MPPTVESLDTFLYTGALLLMLWAGKIGGKWWDERTEKRRHDTDKLARCETRGRRLTESLHEHRNLMIQSGKWTRESLPPFIERERE